MKRSILAILFAANLLWGTAVHAGCSHLVGAMTLASEGFTEGTQPDTQMLQNLAGLIADIDNNALLEALRATGQGRDFGDLRSFLTQLKFIARHVAPGEVQVTPQFMNDLKSAQQIIRNACILPVGSARPATPETKTGLQGAADARLTGIKGKLRSVSLSDTAAFEKNYDLGTLGLIIIGFVSLGFAALLLHLAMIACRILYRGRKTCDVPTTLEVFGGTVEGRLKMIGIYGCIFAPPKDHLATDLSALTENTYCRLVFGDLTLNAKVMKDASETCSLWFTEPLQRGCLRTVLKKSVRPAVYDFGVLRKAHRRGLVFGVGPLPFR